MKRSTDNRRIQRHYGGMAESETDPQAAEKFRRKPYKLPLKISTEEKG